MHESTDRDTPGIARMRDGMKQDDRVRQAHALMMQDAAMAEMHESMNGVPVFAGLVIRTPA